MAEMKIAVKLPGSDAEAAEFREMLRRLRIDTNEFREAAVAAIRNGATTPRLPRKAGRLL